MKMFRKLSFKTKITMISWSFLIPVFFLLYSTISAYDKDISFAQSELAGTTYLRPAVRLLTEVSRLQHMIGSPANDQKRLDQEGRIEAILGDLDAVQASIGVQLQFTESGLSSRKRERLTIENIKKQWSDIKGQTQYNKDTTSKFRQLITDIRGIITHAGDTSNLILDPDLDSYYLMDAVLVSIPQNIDRLDQLETYLNSSELQRSSAQVHAAVFESMLRESDSDRTFADFQTAISEDANFYGTNTQLQTKILPAFELTKALASPLFSSLLGERVFENRSVILKNAAELKASTEELWEVSTDSLDGLLQARIDFFSAKKTRAYTVSGILVLTMMILSLWSINSISQSIEGFVQTVAIEADNLAKISKSLDVSVQNSTVSASRQSAAIEETVASMEEMGSMIAMTNQSTTTTQEEVMQSTQFAKEGESVVHEMVRSMDAIYKSNNQLESIVTLIAGIQSKTKIINDIAFETKLLAFNASIEAARAGAHGRGFAVVAEEVGKLATVSNRAADEVRSLLENSAIQVSSILDLTRDSVQQGQSTTKACSSAFARMQSSIQVISEGISRIATASNEQKAGVTQTNEAMQEMERVAQANLTSGTRIQNQSSGLRSTAETLNSSARGMLEIILGVNSRRLNGLKSNENPNDRETEQVLAPNSSQAIVKSSLTTNSSSETNNKSRWNAA